MEIKEVVKRIGESKHKEWFDSQKTTFRLSQLGYVQEFESFLALYSFLDNQLQGWQKHFENFEEKNLRNLKDAFQVSIDYYKNEIANLDKILSYENPDNQQSKNFLNSLQAIANARNHRIIFPYDHEGVQFLIRMGIEKPKYFHGALDYFKGLHRNTGNQVEADYHAGWHLSFDFDVYQKSIFDDFETTTNASFSEASQKVLKDTNESLQLSAKYISDASKQSKEFQRKINEKLGELMQKFTDVESVYSEKLKLAEPAIYWKTRSKKFSRQGWLFAGLVMVLVLVIAVFLGKMLWTPPETIFESFFGKDKSAAIRWSILFVIFISFLAFTIKTMVKAMFSAFHLARDADERYSLTYFYLSLLNTKGASLKDEEKKLIIQSLFSRSDTGLLKEDSSPTMPNDILSKILSK